LAPVVNDPEATRRRPTDDPLSQSLPLSLVNRPAIHREALSLQYVAQHPGARERVFQMQFVDAARQRQILGRNRPGLVVDAAATVVHNPGLTGDGKIVIVVYHRFALSMPALMSAPSKKSFSSASFPILA
jgi:hypothetical protein